MFTRSPLTLVLALLCLALARPALAADFHVSATSACALADAIRAANQDAAVGGCPAGSGADTIYLVDDITLSAGLPTVRSDITITTDDYRFRRVISGNRAHSMFHIEDWGRLTLRQLDLIDAHSLGLHGGAVHLMQGYAHLTDVRLENNWAQLGGGALSVTIDGSATCDQCRFISNMSGKGGAIWIGDETASLSAQSTAWSTTMPLIAAAASSSAMAASKSAVPPSPRMSRRSGKARISCR